MIQDFLSLGVAFGSGSLLGSVIMIRSWSTAWLHSTSLADGSNFFSNVTRKLHDQGSERRASVGRFNSNSTLIMKRLIRPIQPTAIAFALLVANALLALANPGTKPQGVVQSPQMEKLTSLAPPASNHSATDSSAARMRVVSSRPDIVMAFVAENRTKLAASDVEQKP